MINRYLEKEGKPLDAVGMAEGSEIIYNELTQHQPCMIARFGRVELETILRYRAIKERSNILTLPFWNWVGWNTKRRVLLGRNTGFFPVTISNIERFCDLMLDCASNLDILCSWVEGENLIYDYLQQAKIVPLIALEPYYHSPAWTRALEGKKVLVIHPFVDTIRKQYEKRELLFKYKDILPAFELKTIKAVQSIAGEKVGFADWFEALDYMKEQIYKTDFDVAIIGCGAYGFPLASYVKDIGKQAVHMGGVTQILFGIKGKRWENNSFVSGLYNEYWVRPSGEETPQKATSIEEGCYW